MRFTTIFFDLDDTLYPSSSGLWPAIKERMNSYMDERMHIPRDEIPRLREKYFREYGTTLRGLQANHKVDVQDYLAYVHDLPLKDYLHPESDSTKGARFSPNPQPDLHQRGCASRSTRAPPTENRRIFRGYRGCEPRGSILQAEPRSFSDRAECRRRK